MSLDITNKNYDVLRVASTVTSTGKNILVLPYDREYTGIEIWNITKLELKPTGSSATRYFYKNLKEMGNSLAYREGSFDSKLVHDASGIQKGGIVLPDTQTAPIIATEISKSSPANVTSANHGLVKGQQLRVVSSDMTELVGAVVDVIGIPDANNFVISVDSSNFVAAAKKARMQLLAPESSHFYKILGATAKPNSTLTLSSVEGIVAGAILTLATQDTSLGVFDNKRATVISVDPVTWSVTTNLDLSGVAAYVVPTAPGEISAGVGLGSNEPNTSIVSGTELLGGILLLTGKANPAGEKGDLLQLRF